MNFDRRIEALVIANGYYNKFKAMTDHIKNANPSAWIRTNNRDDTVTLSLPPNDDWVKSVVSNFMRKVEKAAIEAAHELETGIKSDLGERP